MKSFFFTRVKSGYNLHFFRLLFQDHNSSKKTTLNDCKLSSQSPTDIIKPNNELVLSKCWSICFKYMDLKKIMLLDISYDLVRESIGGIDS